MANNFHDEVGTFVQGEEIYGYLTIIEGPGRGTAFPLKSESNPIGRDPEKNAVPLVFGDSGIHREPHAVITYSRASKQFRIVHLGKGNPTFVNDVSVTDAPLMHGDNLRLGSTVMRFSAGPAPV